MHRYPVYKKLIKYEVFVTKIRPSGLDSYGQCLSYGIVNKMAGRADEDNRKGQVAAKQDNVGHNMFSETFIFGSTECPPAVEAKIIYDRNTVCYTGSQRQPNSIYAVQEDQEPKVYSKSASANY